MELNEATGNATYLATVSPGGVVQPTWDAVPGQTYHLQYATLPGGSWNNLGNSIIATNSTATATDVMAATRRVTIAFARHSDCAPRFP